LICRFIEKINLIDSGKTHLCVLRHMSTRNVFCPFSSPPWRRQGRGHATEGKWTLGDDDL